MARKHTVQPPQSVAKPFESIEELEERLSEPSSRLIESIEKLDGDILILGVGGKMGPTLAHLAVRAIAASGVPRRVAAVSSFSVKGLRDRLDALGVTTIQADLLEPGVVEALPDVPNVIYMVGRKFGSTGAEWETWATNVFLPGLVARRFKHSRVVAFSTGAVYPLEPVVGGGSTEKTPMNPVGEYAMSCVGRERMFDYYSRTPGVKVLHFRLNYAVEMRYGVVLDVATQVWNGTPIDLTMGHLNCVWQGYANAVALQCFSLASAPPFLLNVTGPELVSIRWMAARFGELMGREPVFTGQEAGTALLSNAAQCHRLFGYPDVSLDTIIEWVAGWVMSGGTLLGKPTHYATRNGQY